MNIEHIPKELIAKIQKLMKLEEGAKNVGNLEEANNAAAKIRDMLMKHNLDLYTVQQQPDHTQKEVPITHGDFQPEEFTKPHEGDWVKRLVKGIASYYLCKCWGYTDTSAGLKVTIIGTPTNIEILWYTVEQLVNRLRPMSREYFKKYKGREKRNTYFRGFFRGAVEGIIEQLATNAAREVYKAKSAEEERRVGNEMDEAQNTALMNINMQIMAQRKVQQYIEKEFAHIRFGGSRGSSLSGIGGKAQGQAVGRNINISSGLGGSSIPKTRRIG